MLLLWFQSTISAPMLRKFIGCTSSWLVWDKNHNYFHAHTNVKARQLRIELRPLTLEGCTISDFLMEIQNLVDSAIGDPITIREHVDIIIEGLPENYESSVSHINNRSEPLTIDEIETILLGLEARIDKFMKKPVVSVNVASTSTAYSGSSSVSPQANFMQESNTQQQSGNQSQFQNQNQNQNNAT